jgi:DNA-binding transcriptional regulator YbjK
MLVAVVAVTVALQPRGERRRAALLDATLRVVARDGAAGASHRAVAAEAGVPLGSTTYYFESREQMLLHALRYAADAEVALIAQRLRELDGDRLDLAGSRRAVVEWALQEVSEDRAHLLVARHQLRLEALRSPELRAVYGTWTGASLALVQTFLARAGSRDPGADAAVLVAAIDGVTLNAVVLLDGARRRALVGAVVGQAMDRLLGG